jgi:hypothetical protein
MLRTHIQAGVIIHGYRRIDMPATENANTVAVEEKGGIVVHQTATGHVIEAQWAILTPEHWEVIRREAGWVKLTDFAGFVVAERILTG